MLADILQRAVDMRTGFRMNRDAVGTRFGEAGAPGVVGDETGRDGGTAAEVSYRDRRVKGGKAGLVVLAVADER